MAVCTIKKAGDFIFCVSIFSLNVRRLFAPASMSISPPSLISMVTAAIGFVSDLQSIDDSSFIIGAVSNILRNFG